MTEQTSQPLTEGQLVQTEAFLAGPLGQSGVVDAETARILVTEVRRLQVALDACRAAALIEAADEAQGAVGLFEGSDAGAAAAGALEGMAIRFRRMATAEGAQR